MNVLSGGLPGAIGALSLDNGRIGGAAPGTRAQPGSEAAAAVKTPAAKFEPGIMTARAVQAPAKAETAPQTPPNPNLPRGSLIDLKV